MAGVNPQPHLIRCRGPLNRPEYVLAWHLILRDAMRGVPTRLLHRMCWLPAAQTRPSIWKRCRRCGCVYLGRDLPAAVCRAVGVD